MKSNTVTVEFDGPLNQQFYFQPLGRTLRGRFDSRRMANAGRLFTEWPEPIPGQTLTVNFETGECEVGEPLWKPEHTAIRTKIEAKGMQLAPGSEKTTADVPTLHYWLSNLLRAGECKIVGGGELPSKVEGKPRLRFHSNEVPDAIESLTQAVREQTAAIEKLLTKLLK